MTLTGFEPTIPASQRRQTYALNRAAAGIGSPSFIYPHKRTQQSAKPRLISTLKHKILIYLHIIHLLKSCTCFEHYPAHL